jgi:hypothetical protein
VEIEIFVSSKANGKRYRTNEGNDLFRMFDFNATGVSTKIKRTF